MIIQTSGGSLASSALATYLTTGNLPGQRQREEPGKEENFADKVSLSDAGRQIAAVLGDTPEAMTIQQRIDAIKAKPAIEKTPEDIAFLKANDWRLGDITSRPGESWTSDERDYVQKSLGFINTMSALSETERQSLDAMVASGEGAAAASMEWIAMTRLGAKGEIALPDGSRFDPRQTPITPESVREQFRPAVIDRTGKADREFEQLARFLERGSASPVLL